MLKLASEGLLAYGMIWSCDLGTKPSIFGNAWLRQQVEHPETISEKTGFAPKKVHNIVYKLKNEGKIKRAERGLYLKM